MRRRTENALPLRVVDSRRGLPAFVFASGDLPGSSPMIRRWSVSICGNTKPHDLTRNAHSSLVRSISANVSRFAENDLSIEQWQIRFSV